MTDIEVTTDSIKGIILDELLNRFAGAVSKGEYAKLKYNGWRYLKRYSDHRVNIHLKYDWPDQWNIILEDGQIYEEYEVNDGSFGEYLYKEWILPFREKDYINDIFNDIINNISTIEENNNIEMKGNKEMKGFNFDFGPCTGNDNVRLSMYGIAVKNAAGTWVSYNAKDGSIIDVDVFNFEGSKFLYKMPVAVSAIAVGDTIIHNRKPVFVTSLEKGIHVVDVINGEKAEVILTKNIFGFDFATKIVSLFDAFGNAPTPEAPFGNMLPFLMLDDNKDMNDILPIMMLVNGGNVDFTSNPMMLYFLMKDGGKSNDMLPFLFLMNSNTDRKVEKK